MKVRDELHKNFSTAGLPASDDPNINHTTGARVPRAVANWDEVPRLGVVENAGPLTMLPNEVSQSEILAENEARGDNCWSAPKGVRK